MISKHPGGAEIIYQLLEHKKDVSEYFKYALLELGPFIVEKLKNSWWLVGRLGRWSAVKCRRLMPRFSKELKDIINPITSMSIYISSLFSRSIYWPFFSIILYTRPSSCHWPRYLPSGPFILNLT